jgi:hypothetical protein
MPSKLHRAIDSVVTDLRHGVRHLGRRPLPSATIILVLALGIGFNSALFVVVYSLVNSPLPGVTRQESLVRIRGIDRSRGPATPIHDTDPSTRTERRYSAVCRNDSWRCLV